MKIGFGKVDITPRVGVELCGFGPFLNRHSTGVRDRLWARAAAFGDGGATMVVASCDLIGVELDVTREVRRLVKEQTGLPADAVMVQCTHTHSGPPTLGEGLIGWGDVDRPYMELLPGRIAAACAAAVAGMVEARISRATAPCEGIGYNREHDKTPSLEEALREDWRPANPELTDTVCHVIKAEADDDGRLLGFLAYFGCHPVVCCSATRHIHGDFCGVAMGMLEREAPGAVGLFLQGAHGDSNTCVVHKPEQDSLLALDVIASRFARSVRSGLAMARPMAAGKMSNKLSEVTFSLQSPTEGELRNLLAEKEVVTRKEGASDADGDMRMATVYAVAIRRMLADMAEGRDMTMRTEVQGFRIGDVALLGAPFEIFQAIKNDVVASAPAGTTPLVMGLANDSCGYAVDKSVAQCGGYAASQVPFMYGRPPFTDIHGELAAALIGLMLY